VGGRNSDYLGGGGVYTKGRVVSRRPKVSEVVKILGREKTKCKVKEFDAV